MLILGPMSVQVLVGLVNRDNMMVIIRRALAQGQRSGLPPEIEYEDLNKNFVSAAARHLISEQQLAVLQVKMLPILAPKRKSFTIHQRKHKARQRSTRAV